MSVKAHELPPETCAEGALAVARALALLHARLDHEAELAQLSRESTQEAACG